MLNVSKYISESRWRRFFPWLKFRWVSGGMTTRDYSGDSSILVTLELIVPKG
jgi:hypothetical protein